MEPREPSFSERLRLRVLDWITTEGWSVSPLAARDNVVWANLATISLGPEDEQRTWKVVVCQLDDRRDEVVLEVYLEITGRQSTRLNAMPAKARDNFLRDVRMEILRAGLDFYGLKPPLDTIILQHVSYFDGLSKDVLLNRLNHMRLIQSLVSEVIEQRLGPS
jgi:hypothetical protein